MNNWRLFMPKKTYMNSSHILSENFFTKLFKLFTSSSKNMSTQEKTLLKNPTVKRAVSDFNKQHKKTTDTIDRVRQELGYPPVDWSK